MFCVIRLLFYDCDLLLSYSCFVVLLVCCVFLFMCVVVLLFCRFLVCGVLGVNVFVCPSPCVVVSLCCRDFLVFYCF